MSTLPTEMRAQVIGDRSWLWPVQAAIGSYANTTKIVNKPAPKPASDEILVKVEVFAANPTDVLHIDYIGPAGSTIGCDLVGTVVAVGSSGSKRKIGERVFSAVHGGKYPNIGSAAEYCIVPDSLAIPVPQGMPSTEAVTFGVGFLTACIVLYDSLKVPMPPAKVEGSPWIFVSGGSTSVGMFVIQLARVAGLQVIASCSPRSFDLVKSFGANHVVSYGDHAAALKEIKQITNGGVTKGVDCVGGKANLRFAVDAFGPEGGVLSSILPGGKSPRKDVEYRDVLLYRYIGKAFTFIPIIAKFPDEPEKRAFFDKVANRATELISTYGIKANPVEVLEGLEAMPAGWDRLRKKKVSAKKLVFKI